MHTYPTRSQQDLKLYRLLNKNIFKIINGQTKFEKFISDFAVSTVPVDY